MSLKIRSLIFMTIWEAKNSPKTLIFNVLRIHAFCHLSRDCIQNILSYLRVSQDRVVGQFGSRCSCTESSMASCSSAQPLQSRYRAVNGSVPAYLPSYFTHLPSRSSIETNDHRILTNWLCHPSTSLRSADGLSRQFLPPICGTVYLHTSSQHRRWRSSGSVLRFSFSGAPTLT